MPTPIVRLLFGSTAPDTRFAEAVAGGAQADRLGLAFAAGYRAALRALVPSVGTRRAALCATEEGGAHPKAIVTRVTNDRVTGRKRFVTFGAEAELLLVVARADDGTLRLVAVAAGAPGVALEPQPPTRFAPEIPHAAAVFTDAPGEVLPGDGYDLYLKPFRTVEDIHVFGAALAYAAALGRRAGWPAATLARLAAVVAALATLADEDPRARETHLALGGAGARPRGAGGVRLRGRAGRRARTLGAGPAAALGRRARAGPAIRWCRGGPRFNIRRMNFWVAAAGAVPALAVMAYVDRLDAKRPEPRWTLRRVAIYGGLSVLPCVFIEQGLITIQVGGPWAQVLFTAFIVAAAVEELAKVVIVRLAIWNRPEFDERLDGIVYATRAGLGFALVENVAYLLGTKTAGAFVAMYLVRALLAVPGHAIFAGFMGYFAARRRFDNAGPGLLGGYVLAVFLHGSYDAAILGIPLALQTNQGLVFVCLLVPILVVVGGGVALRRRARYALALDDAAEARARAAVAAAQVA